MNRMESGIYHFLPHSIGQNSLVHDIFPFNCTGGWDIEPDCVHGTKGQAWSLDARREDG